MRMTVALENVTRVVGAVPFIRDVSLTLEPGTLSVLLGPTLAGKTSLMRLLAGLDPPTTGRVVVNGKDVTGVDVRKRSVAMVYQQFVNYPSFTVFENIASPLRVQGRPNEEVERRVGEVGVRTADGARHPRQGHARTDDQAGPAARDRPLRPGVGARRGGRRPLDARLAGSIGGLEELDRVARGIVEHDLGAARSPHHVAPEPGPGTTQALDLGGDVVDDELDPVPPTGSGLAPVGHRSPG